MGRRGGWTPTAMSLTWGATLLPPRTEHHCWPPPRSLRNREGQGREGTHHGAVPHCSLSLGRKGGQTPTTMSQLLGVPPSPLRTEHHPWPPPRSLRDCEGQGCEGTHRGESPGQPVSPLPLRAVPRQEGWLDPHHRVPNFWGCHHHPSGPSIIPSPCQGHRGTAMDKGVRGHAMGTVCCDLSLGRRDDRSATTVSLVFGGPTIAPQD